MNKLNPISPVFIIGYPRSGTSLLRVILDSHPDLSIGPELKFIKRIIKEYPETFNEFKVITKYTADDYGYDDDTLQSLFNENNNWHELLVNWCFKYARDRNKANWGEKTPQSYKYIQKLIAVFPEALYIYIVRNPFDVMGSMKKKGWYKDYKSIISWNYANIAVSRLKINKFMFIKYEDFVSAPEPYISMILKKAGLKQFDLLSDYQNKYHGKIADGDLWNQNILRGEGNKSRKYLNLKDKFYIYLFCIYYLIKYGYSFNKEVNSGN